MPASLRYATIQNMKIVPAILTDSASDLQAMLHIAADFTDYAQIDFMDGRFVPSLSIQPSDLRDVTLPLAVEVHLMVEEPDDFEIFAGIGVKQIIFHYEATSRPMELIQQIRSLGMLAGMAVNPKTPLSRFIDFAKHLDTLMVMTVEPGFYGSTFQPAALEKAVQLRADLDASSTVAPAIGVDGGISLDNIGAARAARLDFACVGSALFKADDPPTAFAALQGAATRDG